MYEEWWAIPLPESEDEGAIDTDIEIEEECALVSRCASDSSEEVSNVRGRLGRCLLG